MYTKQWCVLWIVAVTYVIGLVLFWNGFFCVTKRNLGHSSPDDIKYPHDVCGTPKPTDLHSPLSSRQRLKIVFVLIDALSFDLVTSRSLPFLSSMLLNKRALLYRSRAYSPTVTLPRIKTLLTGTVSSFGDVMVNFDARLLREDNWVHQARASGRRVVFYGDDTWLKILPDYYERSEGTTSFFVRDYTEVDNNVTRHVPTEMKAKDWDVLVLHYLGLDHIGHAYGKSSPLIDSKLAEMDTLLSEMYKSLQRRSNESFLIVVTGDHGMSASGSHGGDSENEVMTALVAIPTRVSEIADTKEVRTVSQVDVAPTLSLLMGVPIPKGSCGVVLRDLLIVTGFTLDQRLFATQYNLQQILRVHQLEFGTKTPLSAKAEAALNSYTKLLQESKFMSSPETMAGMERTFLDIMLEMKDAILTSSTAFDMNFVLTGISIAWQGSLTLLMLILSMSQGYSHHVPNVSQNTLAFGAVVSIFQQSTFCALFPSSDSCHSGPQMCLLVSLTALVTTVTSSLVWPLHRIETPDVPLFFLLSCTVFHALSFASSSFVEEEHITWYFLTTTLMLVLCWHFYRQEPSTFQLVVLYRKALLVMVVLRILRSWNSTGDKWAHLPDVADWLSEDSNRHTLASLILAGVVSVILTSIRQKRPLCSFFLYLALLDLCLYKMKLIYYGDAQGVENFYWYLPLFLCLGVFHQFRPGRDYDLLAAVINSWVLLSLLLHTPQNVPMFSLVVLLERAVHDMLSDLALTTLSKVLIYFWFGMCCHFFQGNSNKLSTISVSAGYVGVGTYNPFLVGSLLLSHTYGGFVYWLLMFWKRFTEPAENSLQRSRSRTKLLVCAAFLLVKFAATAWYLVLVVVQRHHIFILTVFSPKLVYEAVHALVVLAITFLTLALLC